MSTLNLTDDVERAAKTLSIAFSESKSGDYIMRKFFCIPLNEHISRERYAAMMHYYTAIYYDLPGGEIAEANNFDAVSLWSLPGKHKPASMTNDPKFNKDFITDLIQRKKEVIPDNIGYYYLFMLGKDSTHPEIKGSVRKIFDEYKKRADAENCAIVLECISDYAKGVYEYFGFENYLTFTYGAGEVNENGEPDSNGKGFKNYLMFYHKDGDKVLRR